MWSNSNLILHTDLGIMHKSRGKFFFPLNRDINKIAVKLKMTNRYKKMKMSNENELGWAKTAKSINRVAIRMIIFSSTYKLFVTSVTLMNILPMHKNLNTFIYEDFINLRPGRYWDNG